VKTWRDVTGLARIRWASDCQLTRPWPAVYFPASQFFFFSPSLLAVKTTRDPEALLPVIRNRIRAREPDLPLDGTVTMAAMLADDLSRPRAALTVSLLFAIAAVILAGLGVYGTVTYEVSQRRYELAIRSAIGASPAQIRDAIIRRGAALSLAGIGAGVAGALVATRLMTTLLFEVTPTDPRAFLVGAGVLLAITLIASYIPSRRAASADPLVALRGE
jgi:ABC-type antimicrobial peptide transport system permease subunit